MSCNPCNYIYTYCPPRSCSRDPSPCRSDPCSSRPASGSCSRDTTYSNPCRPYYVPYPGGPCVPCVPCPPRKPERLQNFASLGSAEPPKPKIRKKKRPSCDDSCDGSIAGSLGGKRVSIDEDYKGKKEPKISKINVKPKLTAAKNRGDEDDCSLYCSGGTTRGSRQIDGGDISSRPSSAASCDGTPGSCSPIYNCTCKSCPIPSCRDRKNRQDPCPCETKVVCEPRVTCANKSVCTTRIDIPPCQEQPKKASKCPGCGYRLSSSISINSETDSNCSGCGWPKNEKVSKRCPKCGRKKSKAIPCSACQSEESYCIQNNNFDSGMESAMPTCINLQAALPTCRPNLSTATRTTCRHGVPYRRPSTTSRNETSACSLPEQKSCSHGHSNMRQSKSFRAPPTKCPPPPSCLPRPSCPPITSCLPAPSCPFSKKSRSIASSLCPSSTCSHFINILTDGNQVMACNISSYNSCR